MPALLHAPESSRKERPVVLFTGERIASDSGASLEFARIMKHRFDVSEHKRVLNRNQEQVRVARAPLRM